MIPVKFAVIYDQNNVATPHFITRLNQSEFRDIS